MGYELIFWIALVLTLASILFSRRDIERWRRMLGSHIILMGLCAFSGALAFFPGVPGIVLGIAGLLPASVAAMHLTHYGFQDKPWSRRSFHLVIEHRQISSGEELLEEQDRLDQEDEHRSLGRGSWTVFLPALTMGATATYFESWLMGVMALGVGAVAAWTVQPAFAPRPVLPAPDKNKELSTGSYPDEASN